MSSPLATNSKIYKLINAIDREARFRFAILTKLHSSGVLKIKVKYKKKGRDKVERKAEVRFVTVEGEKVFPMETDHVTKIPSTTIQTSI